MKLFQTIKMQLSDSDTLTRRLLRTWMPHPGSVLFTVAVVGLVLFVRDVSAFPLGQADAQENAATQTISYQGYLTDTSGIPLDGEVVNITFRLYDALSDGNVVGCEEHRNVTIRQGIFQRALGGGESADYGVVKCPGNDVITLNTLTENALWLGIAIDGDEEMTPRQQLTSVLRAVNAERLGGVDASSYITQEALNTTLQPVKTTIASLATEVPHAVNADKLGEVSANNYITQTNDGVVQLSGTSPGIRIYNPNREMPGANIHLSWDDDVAAIQSGGNGDGAKNGLDFQTTQRTSMMRLTPGGVGIGTKDPQARLEITGSTPETPGIAINTADTGNGNFAIKLKGPAKTEKFIGFFTNNDMQWLMGVDNGDKAPETNFIIWREGQHPALEISESNAITISGVLLDVPDYVFKEGYSQLSLPELRNFVEQENHLPNIPSAEEINQNGLNLGQFQMQLLEKIEELTLYTLAQQDEIEALRQQYDELEERLVRLEKE